MSRRVLILLALCLFISVLALGAPKLQVDHPVHDFHCVPEGSLVYHKFLLRNVGDEPLEINDLGASCGCTVPSVLTRTILPGESLSLEVTFRSAGYGGLAVTQSVHLETNDPRDPRQELFLVGAVIPSESPFAIPAYATHFVHLLIDTRDEDLYREQHLLGAVNIPDQDLPAWIDRLPRGVPILLYDEDGSTSADRVRLLLEEGFQYVTAILGGFNYAAKSLDEEYLVESPE